MQVAHRPRIGAASRLLALATGLLLIVALFPLAGVAVAEHRENTTELDASSNVGAAIAWSQFTFDASDTAMIGRNDKFPDNLASSLIQGQEDAPLLLTDGDELDQEVLDELERLGVNDVHVLGGDAAISQSVENELQAAGYDTHRDAGITRIETAIDIAATHAPNATEALLVRAFGGPSGDETQAWADALAAGAWAAEEQIPVLLTQTEELNDNLREYLEDSDIQRITVIGGTAAISPAVVAELEAMGIQVDRVSGANRFATAVAIAEERGFADASEVGTVILVEGQAANAWASGFAAAAYAAQTNGVIVLSNGENLPPETQAWLEGDDTNNDGVNDNIDPATGEPQLVCGPFVDAAACDAAADALGFGAAPPAQGATFTNAPELISAEIVTSTETQRLVRYVFDEEIVATPIIASAFRLYPPNTNLFAQATQVDRDPDDPNAVRAVFTLNDTVRDATVAAVQRGAVQDSSGAVNPEGSAAVAALAHTAGQTTRPDLVGVTNVNATNETADFTFDQAVTAPAAGNFELIFQDGTEAVGQTATIVTGTDSRTVRVTFTPFADTPAAKRGVVLPDAVTNTAGGNPLQTEPVSGTDGLTNSPDLISVAFDETNDRVTYTFDENVDTLGNPGTRADFRVYYRDGTELTSTLTTERTDSRTVVAQFATGAINQSVAGASVPENVVTRDGGGATNQEGEIGRTGSFAAGETLAPDLVSASKEDVADVLGNVTGRRVRFVFDESINVTSATRFNVYDVAGNRTQLTNCTEDTGTNNNRVTCTFTGTSGTEFTAIGNAVLATVEYDAVRNETASATGTDPASGTAGTVTYPNVEDAAGLTGTTT